MSGNTQPLVSSLTSPAPAAPPAELTPAGAGSSLPGAGGGDQPHLQSHSSTPAVGEASSVAGAGSGATIPAPPGEPPAWWHQRIAKLTAERKADQEARQAAEAELQRLRGGLGQGSTQPTPSPGPAQAALPPLDPAKYQADVQRQAQLIAFNEKCDAVAAKGTNEYKDFPEAMKAYASLGGLEQPFLEAVLATDEPHKVLYELSKDKEKAFAIMQLSPMRQAVEITKYAGKLEQAAAAGQQAAGQQAAGQQAAPPPRTTNAPEPISPKVGARSTGAGEVKLDDPGVHISDWIKARQKDLKTRGVRL